MASQKTLQKLKSIDTNTKYLVNGYIRNHKSIFQPSKYKIFNIIPDCIPCLCILYVAVVNIEYFKTIPTHCITANDGKTVVKMNLNKDFITINDYCYGAVTISPFDNCIVRWDIKIDKIGGDSDTFFIGITSCDIGRGRSPTYIGVAARRIGSRFYVYHRGGLIEDHAGDYMDMCLREDRYRTGDVIGVELDMLSAVRTVSFFKNEWEIGCLDLWYSKQQEYRLIVDVESKGTEISISKFTHR